MRQTWRTLSCLLMLTCAAAGAQKFPPPAASHAVAEQSPRAAEELAPEDAIRRASVNGKYRTLLCVLRVPDDVQAYSAFHDYGLSHTDSWGGYSGLPAGYWVYVYPHWYIWKEQASEPMPAATQSRRSWGPEQATGEPDTTQSGDLTTAWASLTPDGQDEWLLLEYARPMVPVGVIVHETFNPGALSRITMLRPDTEEVEVWKGADPTPPGRGKGVSIIPLRVDFPTQRIKLFLDSRKVPGWNEIDAVGLIDEMGRTHWAVRAEASSTYAEGTRTLSNGLRPQRRARTGQRR